MAVEITPESKVVASDLEWSGTLNRALQQGEKFALLLAMLEDNYLQRPNIHDEDHEPSHFPSSISKHHYPQTPLEAEPRDWSFARTTSELMTQNISDAILWQKMHPQPLATLNDAKRIEPEVIINCGFQTQQRFHCNEASKIDVDETKLYDILNGMN
ncbi:VC2046/SO_2500 family protein [Aliiglaciecola sp. 3_MG-2023]|uniref:VC2046/SO_2500 family protein n=1 Tax=Aliiglaciecola sp. 3_MG-2023 TaxID=3062644 RepID=UPI0026E39040|nr:VC2046/SO_2500 family protein [Aliiglaciecola sp. 3_MG-2023]MDO6693431.1 VC2046/SO_2500 family protein [Aliiglaciecola sp. 3_MG-2023]